MKKTLSFLLALSLALLLLCACTQVTEMDMLDGQTPDELLSEGFNKLDNDQNYVLDITSLTTVSADGTRFETDQSLNTRMVLLKNGDFSVSGSRLWENITINVSASLVGSTLFLKMDQGNNTVKMKTDVSSASDETEEMSEIVNTFVEGFTKFQIEKEWLRNKKIVKDGDNYTVRLTFSEEELTAYNS